jgi:RNA polymerase sigma-70 factor (ECF subfamily)
MTGQYIPEMEDEKDLIAACLRGERRAQRTLYERYSRRMLVLCLRYSRTTAEAEDMLQEGFIRVFRHLKEFRFASRLDTWITRIMVNTALNHNRRKLYLFPMVEVSELEVEDKGDPGIGGLHFSELLKMIQSLPKGCQVVFNLFAIEGYSHQEIAGMLGISEGTSKSQYARARMLMKEKIAAEQKKGYGYGE